MENFGAGSLLIQVTVGRLNRKKQNILQQFRYLWPKMQIFRNYELKLKLFTLVYSMILRDLVHIEIGT